ncbi:UDP-N-acetylmuramate dehydrogenase [uncultured Faecalicoccus sp.]|uniref:UDP-N-acetylmuramate dehydrogenase n=1 Tax=uncultured Faecalicoccus sp. TaxID=1971760 RepID=UPI0026220908|nr:UDP-N-acetylmuramate dehydrogenase [uncultured Faecalicoccus sp.]
MTLLEKLEVYGKVLQNESMKKHTTYRIGGTVDYYIYPKNELALMRILQLLKEEQVPYHVLGRGSNLLCSDNHFHGAIINLDRTLNDFFFEKEGLLLAQAGCSIINLSIEAMKNSLSGLEFASGIPGSLGGALYMNAGAYKSDIASILKGVYILRDGKIEWVEKEDLDYGYRHSLFQNHKDWIILGGCFQLKEGNRKEIEDLMASRRQRRMESQPLDMPCAGSVFRNPEAMPAWKLVESLGLRGHKIGGAQVSLKHSNFIVNVDQTATCQNVLDLISLIQTKAKEVYDIDLITEVERLIW